MSNKVQRFDLVNSYGQLHIDQKENGQYVSIEDYEKLLEENNKLKENNRELDVFIRQLNDAITDYNKYENESKDHTFRMRVLKYFQNHPTFKNY